MSDCFPCRANLADVRRFFDLNNPSPVSSQNTVTPTGPLPPAPPLSPPLPPPLPPHVRDDPLVPAPPPPPPLPVYLQDIPQVPRPPPPPPRVVVPPPPPHITSPPHFLPHPLSPSSRQVESGHGELSVS